MGAQVGVELGGRALHEEPALVLEGAEVVGVGFVEDEEAGDEERDGPEHSQADDDELYDRREHHGGGGHWMWGLGMQFMYLRVAIARRTKRLPGYIVSSKVLFQSQEVCNFLQT